MKFSEGDESICLIDYGLSHKFKDETGHHIPATKTRGRCGNIHFMSLNHMNYWSKLLLGLFGFI